MRIGGEDGERTTTVTRLISSTTTQQTPMPESNPETLGSQTVRGMMAMVRSGGGRLTMKLEPESLGAMRIQLNISQGRVQAQFHASSLQVRELLHQQTESLRSALESQGLRLDRIQIHALQPGSEGDSSRSGSQQQRFGHDQRHDAGDQQSRGSTKREQSQQDQQGFNNRNRQQNTFARRFMNVQGQRAN
jgi:flagellar hook-length control protein FliK